MKNIIWVHEVSAGGFRTTGGAYLIVPPKVKDSGLFPELINVDGKFEATFSLSLCGKNGELSELKHNKLINGRRDSVDRSPEWRLSGDIIRYLKELDNKETATFGFYKNIDGNICFELIPDNSLLKKISPIQKGAKNRVSDVFHNPSDSPVETDVDLDFSIDINLSKPFLLLAGISGTGKTRFVRKQAGNNCDLESSYCLTAVRPDWHEPSDLLGYVSRLSGKSEYVVTDVLKFIVKSWLEIEQSGITLTKNSATGSKVQQQQVKPFWLCLDEMNLAPVEQYFADYLSVLETREWLWNDEAFTYQCDPLLKPSVFTGIEQDKLKKELGLEDHDDLWQHFLENGISIPFNLIVAGTVNMDETTHGFSRKVIDRALTFDFGEFFPNDFKEFFEPTNTPEILGYPVLTDGRDKAALSTTFDTDGNLSIALLESINLVLANTPFKLAYRALNELLLSVISHKPQTAIELAAVWDDFLMCKVLPRIEGDIDKLTKGGEDKNILEHLDILLSDQFKTIWDDKVRPDLYRKSLENDQPIAIECRAKAKLDWMHAQLENGFTSFWP